MPSTTGDPGWCDRHQCDMREACPKCVATILAAERLKIEALTKAIELFCPNVRQAMEWAETYERICVQAPITGG